GADRAVLQEPAAGEGVALEDVRTGFRHARFISGVSITRTTRLMNVQSSQAPASDRCAVSHASSAARVWSDGLSIANASNACCTASWTDRAVMVLSVLRTLSCHTSQRDQLARDQSRDVVSQ